MGESLKAARERVAYGLCNEYGHPPAFSDQCAVCVGAERDLRELQRQAIVGWVVGQGYVMNDLRERHIDALLDSETT